jgi:hypothetical protein
MRIGKGRDVHTQDVMVTCAYRVIHDNIGAVSRVHYHIRYWRWKFGCDWRIGLMGFANRVLGRRGLC